VNPVKLIQAVSYMQENTKNPRDLGHNKKTHVTLTFDL